MSQQEVQQVKETIQMIVKDHIDGMFHYEWDGSDFNSRLMDNLPMDKMSFEMIKNKDGGGKVPFNKELYDKFLNHISEYIFDDLQFNK
jgi:hypothetical protein